MKTGDIADKQVAEDAKEREAPEEGVRGIRNPNEAALRPAAQA